MDLKKSIETHSIMANSVKIRDYVLEENNIYCRIFDMSGNVASPYQFYLTDNTNNIISGFVYFNIKPNYDSILPAINYIENDIINLIESFYLLPSIIFELSDRNFNDWWVNFDHDFSRINYGGGFLQYNLTNRTFFYKL